MANDYSVITERPGLGVTQEQLAMLYTRYCTAAGFCEGKHVLEIACGPGIGLGFLAHKASRVVGGDIDESLLHLAQEQYRGRKNIELKIFDAHHLPFTNRSFDVIVLFEAIYYLENPHRFLEECRRVLCKGGALLICMANKECPEFVSSPFSVRYLSASELFGLLSEHGFDTEIFGAFPLEVAGIKGRAVSLARRVVTALRLMPGSLKVRAILKRVFYGRLVVLPQELKAGMTEAYPLTPISLGSQYAQYKVLYSISYLR